jgi:hypothetical protein
VVVVKAWEELVPICHVPQLRKRDASNLRLSHTAKFQQEVVRCTEEKGENRKADAIFGVDERYIRLWWKPKQ